MTLCSYRQNSGHWRRDKIEYSSLSAVCAGARHLKGVLVRCRVVRCRVVRRPVASRVATRRRPFPPSPTRARPVREGTVSAAQRPKGNWDGTKEHSTFTRSLVANCVLRLLIDPQAFTIQHVSYDRKLRPRRGSSKRMDSSLLMKQRFA